MNFELTSAFSTKVGWTPLEGDVTYTVQWKCGDTIDESKVENSEIVLINLEPETSYDVRVFSDKEVHVLGSVVTYPESEAHLENLYESVRLEDGTYDATQFEKKVHDIFLKYFNTVVKSGDTIYTSVTLSKGTSKKNIETRAVVEGDTYGVDGDQNLFLPFTVDSEKEQVVTLTNNVGKSDSDKTDSKYTPQVDLKYTPSTDSFVFGDRVLKIGDKFELFGRTVTVADGSIVLVFEDTVALTYPFDTTTASNVVGSLGSQFAKNITCNVINVIGSKITGDSGSTYSSAWVYDTTTDTIAEATRIVHTIDETSENATISIGVLHTDASSNAFIEPVIQCAPDATIISAQDASDNTVSTTINPNGISFDTDTACMYFGASQTFRISFEEGPPAILSIQSYDAGSGSYVTKAEFSDGS